MNNEVHEEGISLLDIFKKVKQHILFVIIAIVSCIGLMGAYSYLIQKPQYVAKSSLIMNSSIDGMQGVNYGISIIPTYQEYLETNDSVRERALEYANMPENTQFTITTTSEETKLIIEVVITSYDPEISTKLANAFVEASIDIVNENPEGQLKALGMAEPGVMKKAKGASESRPVVKNCIIGAAAGIVIACAYVFINALISSSEKCSGFSTGSLFKLYKKQ